MADRTLGDSGGTPGGCGSFTVGFFLAMGAIYLFFDSVRVSTHGMGLMSGMMHHAFRGMGWRGGGPGFGAMETTSMGLIFVPFLLGMILLFYDCRWRIGWALSALGVGIIVVEILSRLQFYMHMKTSHLLLLVVMFAAGTGFMLRSFRDGQRGRDEPDTP